MTFISFVRIHTLFKRVRIIMATIYGIILFLCLCWMIYYFKKCFNQHSVLSHPLKKNQFTSFNENDFQQLSYHLKNPFQWQFFHESISRYSLLYFCNDKFVLICNECQENISNKYVFIFVHLQQFSLCCIDEGYS